MRAKKIKATITIFSILIIILLIFKHIFNNNTTTSNATSNIKYSTRPTNINLTDEERRLLIALTHAETTNSSYNEKLAVANIIINRIYNKNFPTSLNEVVYNSKQFSSISNGALDKHLWEYDCGNFNTTNHIQTIKAVDTALNGTNNIENRLYYSRYWKEATYPYNNTCIIKNHIFW